MVLWLRRGVLAVACLAGPVIPGTADAGDPVESVPASRDELLRQRHELREAIAFEKARLALSKGKAFYLVVDAPARTLTLEMNGIPLRTCPIERLEMDRRIVKRRNASGFQDSLATPFVLQLKSGTLPDIPPPVDADTTQTKKAEKQRKKAKFSDADLSFTYDRDLIVHITTRPDSIAASGDMRTRVMNQWRLLRLMLRSWLQGGPFKKQGEIFLQIGRSDARALYWALPDSSGLALRL